MGKLGVGGPAQPSRATITATVENKVTTALSPFVGGTVAKVLGHAVADGFERATRPPVKGIGLGTGGKDDPNVAAAQTKAAATANDKVDWRHPEKALDKMSQIDGNQEHNVDGNDTVRCGAATLVAGAVLLGPQKFEKGLNNVINRAEKVARSYEKLADGFEARGMHGHAEQARKDAETVRDSANHLQARVDDGAKNLTQADLSKVQEDVYKIAEYDEQLTSTGMLNQDAVAVSPYLSAGAINTYRDLMWGNSTPKMGGEKLQIDWVDNQQSARVVSGTPGEGELQGKNVKDFRVSLPRRG
jgi:hypothetical protein